MEAVREKKKEKVLGRKKRVRESLRNYVYLKGIEEEPEKAPSEG